MKSQRSKSLYRKWIDRTIDTRVIRPVYFDRLPSSRNLLSILFLFTPIRLIYTPTFFAYFVPLSKLLLLLVAL